nr:MAG TPA: hypothetical protein [Caudoviricetes sp.]
MPSFNFQTLVNLSQKLNPLLITVYYLVKLVFLIHGFFS